MVEEGLLPAVHDTGDGPPVVFLHAFPQDASMWDAQVAALSGRYRCLRPDAFGCGDSPAPPPDLTIDAVAAAVLAVLDARGVDSFGAVGLSMGGYTAMALLRLAPRRLGALVLADTRADAESDEGRRRRMAMIEQVRREGVESIVETMAERLLAPASLGDAHIADPVRGRIRRCRPEGVIACQRVIAARPDSSEVLAACEVPTLVLVGAEDTGSPPEAALAMSQAIRGARLEVIAGAGHLSNLERPEEFTAAVGGFLDAALTGHTGGVHDRQRGH